MNTKQTTDRIEFVYLPWWAWLGLFAAAVISAGPWVVGAVVIVKAVVS